jgi:hypothetical protein
MTGRSRFTAEELEKMDRYAEIAAKLTIDQICALLQKYRALGRKDITDALGLELLGRW